MLRPSSLRVKSFQERLDPLDTFDGLRYPATAVFCSVVISPGRGLTGL